MERCFNLAAAFQLKNFYNHPHSFFHGLSFGLFGYGLPPENKVHTGFGGGEVLMQHRISFMLLLDFKSTRCKRAILARFWYHIMKELFILASGSLFSLQSQPQ